VEHKLKTIAASGIAEALSKAQLYRYLREPEESESICQDILAADPENQAALRLLGLSITDQFTGDMNDRYGDVESIFRRLTSPYAQHYYLGILSERRAKAQMRAGLLMALESSGERVGQIARQMLAWGRPIPLEELVAKVEAVTVETARSAGRALIARGQMATAVLGLGSGLESAAAIAESLTRRAA